MPCWDPYKKKGKGGLEHERPNSKLCVQCVGNSWEIFWDDIEKISAEKLVLDAEQTNGVKWLLDRVYEYMLDAMVRTNSFIERTNEETWMMGTGTEKILHWFSWT